jgi:hypothetical protein
MIRLHHLLVVLCSLVYSHALYAQADFRPGYVILNSNDTLHGEIDYSGDVKMASNCRFRSDANAEVKEYKPQNLIGYRFDNSKFYVAKETEKGLYFLEFIIKGKLNVYRLWDGDGVHYYVEKEGYKLIELPYEEHTESMDGKLFKIKSEKHKDRLRYYLKDAKELYPEIESIERPDRKKLIILAKDYHHFVCKNDSCIVYEKNYKKSKIALELLLGASHFPKGFAFAPGWYFEQGLLFYISVNSNNENVYFKTGLTHVRLKSADKTEKADYLKIPFQFQYLFPKGVVRPKFSGGLNVYIPYGIAYAINAGANIQLAEKLSLVFDAELESVSNGNTIMPSSNIVYSLTTGLRFALR